jgi:hypothetical protein
MNQRTGYPILDVRMALYIPGAEISTNFRLQPLEIARVDLRGSPGEGRRLGAAAKEALESIVMVNSPLTWLCIAGWLAFRRILPGRRAEQALIATVVVVEIALILTVKANMRYFTCVAGLVQIWGALGLVVLTERVRMMDTAMPLPRRLAGSMRPQLAALGGIVLCLSAWSVLSTNIGFRSAELRELGVMVRQRFGPDKVFLAGSPEMAYYAAGRMVTVVKGAGKGELSPQSLSELCREKSVDFIVIRSKERWAPWLIERAANGHLPAGALVASAGDASRGGPLKSYLLDARVLFGEPSSNQRCLAFRRSRPIRL